MKKLTQKDILKMSIQERKDSYENNVDIGCNANPNSLEFEIAHHNQSLLESKIQFNEF